MTSTPDHPTADWLAAAPTRNPGDPRVDGESLGTAADYLDLLDVIAQQSVLVMSGELIPVHDEIQADLRNLGEWLNSVFVEFDALQASARRFLTSNDQADVLEGMTRSKAIFDLLAAAPRRTFQDD